MKTNFIKGTISLSLMSLLFIAVSCDQDSNFDPEEVVPAVSNFEFTVDQDNTLLVHFSSSSVYAESYMWAFGDGTTSTDENPSHIFSDGGTFAVSLTALNSDGEGMMTKDVTVVAPAPNLVVGGDMSDASAWTFDQIFVGADNNVLHGVVEGEFMWKQEEGVVYSNAYIYQEIAVQAGVPYSFNASLRSEGTFQTWFEVFVGSTMPERELDYGGDHGVKLIDISGWGECGQSAYDGSILSVCDIPENDIMDASGIITFTEDQLTSDGTVFLVFKSGQWDGDYKEGIYLDNVELKEVR